MCEWVVKVFFRAEEGGGGGAAKGRDWTADWRERMEVR